MLVILLLLNFSFAKQSNYQEIKDKTNPTIKMTLLKKFMINYKDKERVRKIMAQNRKEGKRKLRALDKDAPK